MALTVKGVVTKLMESLCILLDEQTANPLLYAKAASSKVMEALSGCANIAELDPTANISSKPTPCRPSADDVIKTGMLLKKSRNRQVTSKLLGVRSWKSRRFVLRGDRTLLYFDPASPAVAKKGSIDVSTGAMVRAVAADQVDGHSHAFQVVTALTNETLLFAAESDQDAKEWVLIIIVNLSA